MKKRRKMQMLSEKDKIEQFKRDCKSVHYYTEMFMQCNEKLEEIANQLEGLGSPRAKEIIYENAGDPYKTNILGLMVMEDQVKRERDEYVSKINYVNKKLMQITDPVDKAMIEEVYLRGKAHEKVAKRYHMDRMTMYRRINKAIKQIL